MSEDKIVIVIDDQTISKNLEEKLTESGYSVIVSEPRINSALSLIFKINPSIIVISVKLESDYSGIELAARIKNEINVPIIFISLSKDKEAYLKAKKVNPIAYFTQPFEIENLFSTEGTNYEKGNSFGLLLNKELVEKNGDAIRFKKRKR